MLNPVRALKGKLNFLKVPNNHVYKIIQLANSIPNNQKSSLDNVCLDQIKSLRSLDIVNTKQFNKFLFDFQCHNQNRIGTISNSIYEDLIPQQKKIASLLNKFTSKLNTRQMAYLNFKLREKINSQIPHWGNLHLNNDSPSKRDIMVLPTLHNSALQVQLKSLSKKTVNKVIKTFHDNQSK